MNKTFIYAAIALAAVGTLAYFNNTKKMPEKIASAVTDAEKKFENWHLFRDMGRKFHVKMPTLPQHTTKETPIENSKETYHDELYASQKSNEALLMIVTRSYPTDEMLADEQAVLKKHALETAAANPLNSPPETEEIKFKGKTALKFQYHNQEANAKGLAFVNGKTLYTLMRVGPLGDNGDSEFDYFISTFELEKAK